MEIVNRVITLGNVGKSDLEQICFKCPGLLKDDLKVIANHYNLTVTSLIINSCAVLVEDFKGTETSTLNIHQSRACLKLDDLEERLEEYLGEENEVGSFEHRGYLLNEKALSNKVKVNKMIDRIENLKKLIGIGE